jgi:hypothetical protein
MATFDRPGTESPVGAYACECDGFEQHRLEGMCLRCLNVYAEGLPLVLTGESLAREMRHVAGCLKRIVDAEPHLGEQHVFVPAV